MGKKIYIVMYSYYSDWEIYGYFTNREDAEKYCVAHEEQDLHVEEVNCYDDIDEDFRNIELKYTYRFLFRWRDDEYELMGNDFGDYSFYQGEFLKSNKFESFMIDNWIRVYVNVGEKNIDKAQKIAIDLFYQYMSYCNNHPTMKTLEEFNLILNKEERDRKTKEAEDELREKEMLELYMLKEKYEKHD